jgi:hypothetical protein
MTNNPFSLPGRPDPVEALDPLSGDPVEVLKHYVAVDNTEEAFRQFSGTVPDPAELMKRGQLIVAMGIDGGGKSSLINKCAWAIGEAITAAGFQLHAIDTRGQAAVTDEQEVRIGQVADFVLLALRRAGVVTIEGTDLERLENDPVSLYSRLGLLLEGDVIVVVRLPPAERLEEIVQYAQLSHPRLVFFAELRGKFGHDAVRSRTDKSYHRRPIVLEVGPLGAGHGEAFVKRRFELNNHSNVDPKLEPAVVEQMISSRQPSIREFQTFLYLMYERMRASSKAPKNITWQYALESYYKSGDEL